MSPLFVATAEATEEAVYNALLMATTVEGNGNRVEAIPVPEVRRLMARVVSRP
jgi:D-aminopeptidase